MTRFEVLIMIPLMLILIGVIFYMADSFTNDLKAREEVDKIKRNQAAEYVITCIEEGKRADDCKTLADAKFYGRY